MTPEELAIEIINETGNETNDEVIVETHEEPSDLLEIFD
jgi:hypothetical protein